VNKEKGGFGINDSNFELSLHKYRFADRRTEETSEVFTG
jgi:hypothetical protein